MAFWGVEVKPGKPFTLVSTEDRARLRLSQATLGIGSSTTRSVLQCNVGDKSPLFLCVLSPEKVDSCQLNLEFQEADPVVFSVLGPRTVHLTGYFLPRSTSFSQNDDESESFGEDIVDTDVEKASSDDYDYSDSFINDDDPPARGSHVSSTDDDEISIKEMASKTKDKNRNGKGRRLRKKFQVSDSESDETSARVDDSCSGDSVQVLDKPKSVPSEVNPAGQGLHALGEGGNHKIPEVLSSENPLPSRVTRSKARSSTLENGEPSAKFDKTLETRTPTHTPEKREDKPLGEVEKSCETPSKKKRKERSKSSVVVNSDEREGKTMPESLQNEKPANDKVVKSSSDVLPSQNGDETVSKKKRKRDRREEDKDGKKNPSESEATKQENNENTTKEAGSKKPPESEVLSNGMIIEKLENGEVDGKAAVTGKRVSILYTGKLRDTGKVFDSNMGEAPLKFRLGGKKVIEGLSIGVEGMRVGAKRKLTIPPWLGYSDEGLKDSVPKNAWLVYVVEAVKIK